LRTESTFSLRDGVALASRYLAETRLIAPNGAKRHTVADGPTTYFVAPRPLDKVSASRRHDDDGANRHTHRPGIGVFEVFRAGIPTAPCLSKSVTHATLVQAKELR